jgi:hypothetical protein
MTTPFPKLPKGLPEKELRAEIRRRLKIMGSLGLIKKPRLPHEMLGKNS